MKLAFILINTTTHTHTEASKVTYRPDNCWPKGEFFAEGW